VSGSAAAGVPDDAPRNASTPTTPPNRIAATCPGAPGTASTRTAAATASVARSRSGASERIIPRTACATTATAATFKPRSHPEPPGSPSEATPLAKSMIAMADGSVKPTQAATAPA
jgi:hypothetical protein